VHDPAPRTLRGRALFPRPGEPRVDLVSDALIEIDASGRIAAAGPAPRGCAVAESHPGAVLMPGLVDTHLHFPQTRVIGSASGPLLEWLRRSVFPEEARFADAAYAAAVAVEFCDALIAQGTTCAAIYGSSHPPAVDALLSELSRRGLRALAGLTLMDRDAPAEVLLPAGEALDACAALVERWHDHDAGRLRVAVVPRFALSCSPALLRGAADLAAAHGLWIQTHLSENRDEVRATSAAFPEARDYLAVYQDHGLVGARTVLAHCIWLADAAWDRIASAGAAIAHCPDSNFFLGSGCMALRQATSRGVAVGLGTDVGAGRSFSVRRIAAAAYDTSLILGAPAAPEELLWLATAGGARALGLGDTVGRLAPGLDADVIAVPAPGVDDALALIDSLLFRHDAGPVAATYVRGRRLFGADPVRFGPV
jgi:guanine deaminase